MHPNDPAAVAAPTTERDVDAQCPEESLRAAEAASERAGVFGPAGPVTRYPISPALGASTQKVKCKSMFRTPNLHHGRRSDKASISFPP